MPTGHCLTTSVRLTTPTGRKPFRGTTPPDVVVIRPVRGQDRITIVKPQNVTIAYPGTEGGRVAVGGALGLNPANPTEHLRLESVHLKVNPIVAIPRLVRVNRRPGDGGLFAGSMDKATTTLVVRVTGPSVTALEVRGEGVPG